jgi:hypothetical protein
MCWGRVRARDLVVDRGEIEVERLPQVGEPAAGAAQPAATVAGGASVSASGGAALALCASWTSTKSR